MIRRAAAMLVCMILVISCFCLLPVSAPADNPDEQKIVRVGWYDTPFNYKDAFNRRTGYAYEYQRKIAAYTGWKYEYVEGNWPELLQMLEDGRIDLMSDVSYMEERAEYMLYSNLPMGQELYYLYVSPDNTDISPEDYSTLNGKKVGVTKATIQASLFRQWMNSRDVAVDLVELECSEADSFAMMKDGELDAFVTLDSYGDSEFATPLWKIGASDFYFAVRKDRPDLLSELDAALNRIQDENKYYNEQLSEKYFRNPGTNHFLTAEEREWLESHGPIRIGYQDNYLAFCAADDSGALTGALKDYLAYAATTLDNASPQFVPIAYPTASAAIEALKNGEIDCMFPANLKDYDAEEAGLIISPPMMRTEMDAVIREADRADFLRRNQVRVGVNKGNPNYEMFLLEHFPAWTPVYYSDTSACLDAVAGRTADCIIISNYRYRDISAQCEKLGLTTIYTGVDMDYCLAVKEGNTILYSILSRMICEVPESTANAALTYYSTDTSRHDLKRFIRDYPYIAIGSAVLILVLVLLLIFAFWKLNKPGKSRSDATS